MSFPDQYYNRNMAIAIYIYGTKKEHVSFFLILFLEEGMKEQQS